MIAHIALRELRQLFLSPLAWVLLAVSQLILAWVFFASIDAFFAVQGKLGDTANAPGVTDLIVSPLLDTASVVLLMITPLLSMRLIAGERRHQTLPLLLSSPVHGYQIVVGKYLGVTGFMLIFVCMLALMPLSLQAGTELDLGKTFSGLLGLFLLLAAMTAAGLYLSSLTDNPVIAATGSFGLLLLLWIIGASTGDDGQGSTLLQYLSLTSHFNTLLRGVLRLSDLAYYALFIVFFLGLSVRQLENRRVLH